jgi:hypothetical protein
MKDYTRTQKCKFCGQTIEISRDGWAVFSKKMGNYYVEWIHLVGHLFKNSNKPCPGSGASPAGLK